MVAKHSHLILKINEKCNIMAAVDYRDKKAIKTVMKALWNKLVLYNMQTSKVLFFAFVVISV